MDLIFIHETFMVFRCYYLIVNDITSFLGYVLPWGQMSYWAATVITNLASTVPFFGQKIVYWLWSGFSVDNPTLSKFFSLHYIYPLYISFCFITRRLLHQKGSSNRLDFLSNR